MGPDSAVTVRGKAAIGQVVQQRPGVTGKPVRLAGRPLVLAGREELLADLGTWLTGGDGSQPRTVALWGQAGAGKTSVAVEYAHRQLAEVGVAWQLAAYDPTVLAAGFGELADQLGARDPADQRGARDWAGTADPVASVHAALAKLTAGWLLIFDNAADRASVERFLPPVGRGQVLITSQSRDWPVGQGLQVPVLTREVGADFLVNRTGDPDPWAAADLATELGGLPLALEQAVAYTRATGDSLAGYLASFRQRRLTIVGRGEPEGDSKAVATTWALAFGRLEQSAPGAAALLRLLAFCAPEAIPLRLLHQLRPELSEGLRLEVAAVLMPLLKGPRETKDAIDMLRLSSLVRPAVGGSESVHRLVQAVTRDQIPPELAEAWQEAAAAVIEAAIPKDPEQPDSWPEFAALVPHALAALTAKSDGTERIALYLGCSGSYVSARDLQRKVVEAREILSSDRPEDLRARAKLAEYTGKAGNPAGARDQYATLLPIVQRVYGPEDKETLDAWGNLYHWKSRTRLKRLAWMDFDELGRKSEESDRAKERARRRKAVEQALGTLVSCEPTLLTAVRGYAGQKMAIRRFVEEAVARHARGTDIEDYFHPLWWAFFGVACWLIPLAAWLLFNSQYSWLEWVAIGFGVGYATILVIFVLWRLTPESAPPDWTAIRWLIVSAATAAAVFFIVRWHGGRPGGWQVVALGVGLLAIPANMAVTQTRRKLTQARPDQMQMLALDFVDLLGASHPAALNRLEPPEILVAKLEASARHVQDASQRAAYSWRWTERQVRSQIREFGGSVAAGLRWHKRLVVMPVADASAALFASFGYGLVAAVTGDWERLMFEPASSGAQSFWRRYRGRLAFAGILGVITALTFIFPKVLPSGTESPLRGLLVLTAAFSLLKPPGETITHIFDAYGGDFLGGGAAAKWK